MEEKELPKGWKIVKLGEVCNILDNMRVPINSSERVKRIEGKSKNELFPYYGATGQVGFIDEYIFDGEYVLLGEDAAPFLDPFKDKAYLVTGKFWVNNHAHILQAKESNKFLLHYLNVVKYIDFVTGTTRLKLNQSRMKEIPVPLPLFPEQTQIVSKIEELFSEIDKGVEQMKLAQEQLKVYRQSVLKWAFEGKLTNENVKEGELPKGWKWKAFGDIMDLLTDYHSNGSYEKLKENVELKDEKDYATMIRATNFEKKNFKDFKYISKSAYNFLAKSKLFGGEILIGKIGNAGRIYFMPNLKRPCSLAMNLFLVRVNNETNNKYIHYHLISEKSKREISSYVKGVGNPTIDKKSIRKIAIAYPPLEEQELIVSEIESRLSVCDKLEETIETSLKQAETLRQSILKKAFEGKLI